MHLLHDFPWARELWEAFLPNNHDTSFFLLSAWDWIKHNLCGSRFGRDDWHMVFMVVVWQIWKRRNEAILGNNVIMKDLALQSIWIMIADMGAAFVPNQRLENRVSKALGWSKPPIGWMKLNSDGSAKGSPKRATIGGLI